MSLRKGQTIISGTVSSTDKLPEPRINDRYLHTTNTGQLEWAEVQGGGGGTWSGITGKPFTNVDTTTLKVENDTLKVNTTTSVLQDNTQPITSGAVHTAIYGIEALLHTI